MSDGNLSYTDCKKLIPSPVQYGESSGSLWNTDQGISNGNGIQSTVDDSKSDNFYAGPSKSDAIINDTICQHDSESQSPTSDWLIPFITSNDLTLL